MGPQAWAEAERYAITCHEYTGGVWSWKGLFRYYDYVLRELDAIQASGGIDYVIACETDNIPAPVWHRMTRRLRYKIYREEVDYYWGSRFRGYGLKDRVMRGVFDAIEGLLHTQCDLLFTLNRYAKARLAGWGVPDRKIVVTGLWRKDEYFVPDREAYKPTLLMNGLLTPDQVDRIRNKIVVSFYGFFYEHTHLPALLDVVPSYPDDLVLLLAGKGHHQTLVEQAASEHPNIVYLGWKDHADIQQLYRVTDIVYQPLDPRDNINWKYFGSTNKTFECIAAGCLFIGSDINERIDLNREAEFMVPIDFRRDVREQLHELFRAIIANPEQELRRRQRNARKLFERYNYDTHARVWRALFDPQPR